LVGDPRRVGGVGRGRGRGGARSGFRSIVRRGSTAERDGGVLGDANGAVGCRGVDGERGRAEAFDPDLFGRLYRAVEQRAFYECGEVAPRVDTGGNFDRDPVGFGDRDGRHLYFVADVDAGVGAGVGVDTDRITRKVAA